MDVLPEQGPVLSKSKLESVHPVTTGRTLALMTCVALLLSAVVATPATAAKPKKKKKPKPPACAPFTPGEDGAEAPTIVLNDTATEAKPVEHAVVLDISAADFVPATAPPTEYFNIQVDTNNPDVGVYVLWEFPDRRDYDMNLLHGDGTPAAQAQTFNTGYGTPAGGLREPGHGGEGTEGSEKLIGIRTADCAGWTVETQNWFGEGGEFTLKLWLGEAVNDPLPPGETSP